MMFGLGLLVGAIITLMLASFNIKSVEQLIYETAYIHAKCDASAVARDAAVKHGATTMQAIKIAIAVLEMPPKKDPRDSTTEGTTHEV